MPHAAAANLTKTGTTRVVFFASNILNESHEGWQYKHVREFFSTDGADKRFREATLNTTLMDPEIFKYLCGAESVCYQELDPL
jgi:hypothetical protein